METTLWVLQGLLAAFFVMPVMMKLTSTKNQLIEKQQLKPGDSVVPIRVIGVLELLGIIGIILPQLTGIFPVLTPVAAVGFSLVMVGAFFVHLNKKEYKVLPMLVVVLVLSATVAYFRF